MEFQSFYEFLANLGYTHPIHPTIVYIPIGMVMGGFVFVLLSFLPGFEKYLRTARHCITLAFLGIFPTALLGYMDWQYFHGGNWMNPIQMKIILAGVLTFLLLVALISHAMSTKPSFSKFLIHLLSFAAVVAIGYYGGEIVFGPSSGQAQEHAHSESETASGQVGFAAVQQIFENRCVKCHSGQDAPHNLQLTSHQEVMAGAGDEKVVIPNKPGQSELLKRIKGIDEPRMPLSGDPLSDEQIQTVEKWIEAGAPSSN